MVYALTTPFISSIHITGDKLLDGDSADTEPKATEPKGIIREVDDDTSVLEDDGKDANESKEEDANLAVEVGGQDIHALFTCS